MRPLASGPRARVIPDLPVLAAGLAMLTIIGTSQVIAGWIATVHFVRGRADITPESEPISILKPLHGDEPLLEQALTTLFEQDRAAEFQIIFGVQDPTDTAIPVVRTLRARYPDRDVTLIIDPTRHGGNPKVGNLINMFPAARHDIIVIADADVHVTRDYLLRLANALARPGVGLVTAIYVGLPAFDTLASRLGGLQITHGFLPGALLGRAFGRGDCLGATMCLRRETLAQVGGLEALKDHLADDNVLGRLVRSRGLDVALAGTVVATTVPERFLPALWRHEMRWARTIRTLEPAAFAASVLQYPLFFAALTVLAAGFAVWGWILLLTVWAVRALAAMAIDRALGGMHPYPEHGGGEHGGGENERLVPKGVARGPLAFGGAVWLLPLRDLLSVAEWIVSHAGRRVEWRGQTLRADTPPRFTQGSPTR